MSDLNLQDRRIAIVAHVLKYAEAEDLLRFVTEEGAAQTLFIGHPLAYVRGRPGSRLRLYQGTTLTKDFSLPNRQLPGLLQYLRDTILTIAWCVTARQRWDVIVACDNLNAFSALILKRLRVARHIVYYTIDFVPKRFDNHIVNEVYHWLDKLAVRHADLTWNVSDRIAEGRESVRGLQRSKYPRQVTVPIGGWFQRLPRRPFDEIEQHSIVYSGGLLPHQGVSLVIDSIPAILESLPDFRMYITGMGPLEEDLKARTSELGIEECVHFLGYLESHEELHELLCRCAAGVAMYSADLDIWSKYAEPAKIKRYLSAGLPVFTTSVTYIAPQLAEREAGVVLPYDSTRLAAAVVALLSDEPRLRRLRQNALAFGSEFDWPAIFSRALSDPRLGLTDPLPVA